MLPQMMILDEFPHHRKVTQAHKYFSDFYVFPPEMQVVSCLNNPDVVFKILSSYEALGKRPEDYSLWGCSNIEG